MTQPPLESSTRPLGAPRPVDPQVTRARRLLIVNLTGFALLLFAGASACFIAWLIDPLALASLLTVAAAVAGWALATTEGA